MFNSFLITVFLINAFLITVFLVLSVLEQTHPKLWQTSPMAIWDNEYVFMLGEKISMS